MYRPSPAYPVSESLARCDEVNQASQRLVRSLQEGLVTKADVVADLRALGPEPSVQPILEGELAFVHDLTLVHACEGNLI